VCVDVNDNHMTSSVERSVYTLASAEESWSFTFDVDALQASGCTP